MVREASDKVMHKTSQELIEYINMGSFGWTAALYPDHETFTRRGELSRTRYIHTAG